MIRRGDCTLPGLQPGHPLLLCCQCGTPPAWSKALHGLRAAFTRMQSLLQEIYDSICFGLVCVLRSTPRCVNQQTCTLLLNTLFATVMLGFVLLRQ